MRKLSSLGGTMNSHTNKSQKYHYDYSNQPFSCDMTTSPTAGNTEFHMLTALNSTICWTAMYSILWKMSATT